MRAIQADEHVPQEVITGLNARGREAHCAYHECLSGKPDRDVFDHAQRTNRIFRTNDTDFFSLIEENTHRGVFYLTTQRAPLGRIIRDIARLIDASQPEDVENGIFYIPQSS